MLSLFVCADDRKTQLYSQIIVNYYLMTSVRKNLFAQYRNYYFEQFVAKRNPLCFKIYRLEPSQRDI